MNIRARTLAAAFWVSAAACSPKQAVDVPAIARWYTQSQIDAGRAIFKVHCSSCHGERAEGTSEWRELGPDGHYPPPPLNGSAHAWHHSLGVLDRVIDEGGASMGGVMPAFGAILSAEERLATVAYFQSFWPDEIYKRWDEMNRR